MTSSENIKLKFLIKNESGKVVHEMSGISRLTLPLLFLDETKVAVSSASNLTQCDIESIAHTSEAMAKTLNMNLTEDIQKTTSSTTTLWKFIYYVEAYVEDNSWPLSGEECRVVEQLRNAQLYYPIVEEEEEEEEEERTVQDSTRYV